MPVEGWNGKLDVAGNGGLGSNIQYADMAKALSSGYAAAGTDTGHDGNTGAFGIGHPEKIVDWGNRAIHETVLDGKAVTTAFYGSAPKYSYYNSCSTGGRQGWVEAEYYPNDFDGLAIGDPANPMNRLQANSIAINLMLTKDEAHMIPQSKWPMIHQAVLDECDAKDGAKDGVIMNPLACNFDPKTLLCKDGDAPNCLTAPQLESLNQITNGSKNPRTGEQLYPGYPLGTAMGGIVAGPKPDNAAPETFKMLFQDANWDYHTFDFDKDTARADKLANNVMNAVEPAKLKQVFAHNGKMLLYHGWEDSAITPEISIKLYEDAVAANGGLKKTYDNMRLFLVAAMGHCGGDTLDKLGVLNDWVEHGKAPDSMIATEKGGQGPNAKPDRTLLVCPYPESPKYKGSGSITDPSNFACVKP